MAAILETRTRENGLPKLEYKNVVVHCCQILEYKLSIYTENQLKVFFIPFLFELVNIHLNINHIFEWMELVEKTDIDENGNKVWKSFSVGLEFTM
jgi:hypothetical protein